MTPNFYMRRAEQLFPYRKWFLGVSLMGIILAVPVFTLAKGSFTAVFGVLVPSAFVAWCLYCMCIWFHPESGSLRPGARRWAPAWWRPVERWHGAIALSVFLLGGGVVVPFLVIFS